LWTCSTPAACPPRLPRSRSANSSAARRWGKTRSDAGTRAMLISAILVPIFMLWYYRFFGHRGQHRLGVEHADLVCGDAGVQGGLHPDRLRRPGADGGHGPWTTTSSSSSGSARNWTGGPPCAWAIRNAFHRAGATIIDWQHHPLDPATVLLWLGSDQFGRLRHYPLDRRGHPACSPRLRRAGDLRRGRKAAMAHQGQDAAADRPHELRLHGLVPLLHHRLDPHLR